MRTSFAASVLAIVPLLASQAMAAPAPAPAPAPAAEPGFLSPLFSGSGFSGGEKKLAQIDEPWQLLNLYIFPNTPGDKKFQFRFGFSDNNPSNEMYITCIKLASSEEELIMDKYESCGDTDVQFRYLGDRVQLWRTFDKNTVGADGTGRAQAFGETGINLQSKGEGYFYQSKATISPVQNVVKSGL